MNPCYMPGIVLCTRDIGIFLLLVSSDSPAEFLYHLVPSSHVHGEARVIEILSDFHVFRQCGCSISSFTMVDRFFVCLFNLFTILPKHEQQKDRATRGART